MTSFYTAAAWRGPPNPCICISLLYIKGSMDPQQSISHYNIHHQLGSISRQQIASNGEVHQSPSVIAHHAGAGTSPRHGHRPRPPAGLLRRRPQRQAVSERVPMPAAVVGRRPVPLLDQDRHGRRPPGQPERLQRDGAGRVRVARREHAGRVHEPRRLRARRHQPRPTSTRAPPRSGSSPAASSSSASSAASTPGTGTTPR